MYLRWELKGLLIKECVDLMQHAPVIIPTLCRYKHFKECIESLSKCASADKTEVYIGLDYPAKDSHWEGYNKIKEYLETCGDLGFKKLHIVKREHNYGVTLNNRALLSMLEGRFSSYIYSEDDNVFSPNFLEYINKGLERYEKDSSVYAICGYCYYPDIIHTENNYYRVNIGFSPWGYGTWFDRVNVRRQKLTRRYYFKKLINPMTVIRTRNHSYTTLLFLIIGFIKKNIYTDNIMNMYMYFEKKDVVMPVISKVKNMGFDGSGEHCRIEESYAQREIDTDTAFDYIGTGMEHYNEINERHLIGQRADIDRKAFYTHLRNMFVAKIFHKE